MPLQKLVKPQMKQRLSFSITMAMLIGSACSCQVPVNIKDGSLWYLQGESGATQLKFLSPGQSDLTKPEWDAISPGKVCMESDFWASLDKEISELCTEVTCNYEVLQAADIIHKTVQQIQGLKKPGN